MQEALLVINDTMAKLGDSEIILGRTDGKVFWAGSRKVTSYVVQYKYISDIFPLQEHASTQVLAEDSLLCATLLDRSTHKGVIS